MLNIEPTIIKKFKEAIKKPVGTISFVYTFDQDLFDDSSPNSIFLEIISGEYYVRLAKEDNKEITFYHSSPGTGTRIASIDLKLIQPSKKLQFFITWTLENIQLHIGSIIYGGNLISSNGRKSEKSFRIDKNGEVIQIGDVGTQTMNVRVNDCGIQIIKPSAIEIWQNTKLAIEVLQTGKSEQGYIFEVIKANFILVMLVTGFESYCKNRIQELDMQLDIIDWEAIKSKKIIKHEILKANSNYFQNFGNAEKFFRIVLGIKFSHILSSDEIAKIKEVFTFRHRIVHVNPLLPMVNELEVPKIEPIFSTNLIQIIVADFDDFVIELHAQTLIRKQESN